VTFIILGQEFTTEVKRDEELHGLGQVEDVAAEE